MDLLKRTLLARSFVSLCLVTAVGCSSAAADGISGEQEGSTPTGRVSSALKVDSTKAPPTSEALEAWHKAMAKTPLPKKGCFHVSHPATTWEETPCVAPPDVSFRISHKNDIGPETVGNGTDDSAQVVGVLSSVVGSFPTVTGVTSESDGIANSFSLQVNTNFFTTSTCNGSPNQPNCRGWQQFIFANDGSTGVVFMQYWLINYGTPCPTGWTAFSGSCYKNSAGTSVPVQTIANLSRLKLTGNATPGGQDTAIISTGSGNLQATGQDSVLNVAQGWNFAEFNIFGDGSARPTASFNAGSTITVRIGLTNGSTDSPTCVVGGTTGERNNLTLVPASCCPSGGASPAIRFLQSNVAGVAAPFCLLNDITPIQSVLR